MIDPLIARIILTAKEYKLRFGKPLGVLGEVGEHIVAYHFGLKLEGHLNPSFDATSESGRKIQIKSRIFSRPSTDRIGNVKSGGYDDLLVASFNDNFDLLDAHIISGDALELEISKYSGNGKNARNPSIGVIRKFGKSLKNGDVWLKI